MLVDLKFPSQFVDWIAGCVNTFKFLLEINEGLVGYFGEQKGLRQ